MYSAISERVRLVGGAKVSEGRLEVFHNDTWGTVCNDFFNLIEGIVVCRQLNYTGIVSVLPVHPSDIVEDRPIWLDDVDCSGNEDSILDCYHQEYGVNDCGHSEDVWIACGKKFITNHNFIL